MDAGINAALIGAAATLTVAGVGFWQWRRSGLNAERNAYRQQRVAVLKQLWENLQSLEAESRVQPPLSPDNEAWSATETNPRVGEVMAAYGIYTTHAGYLMKRYRDVLQGDHG